MDSESTLMIKALFLSLLLHAFVIVLLNDRFSILPESLSYSPIRVNFASEPSFSTVGESPESRREEVSAESASTPAARQDVPASREPLENSFREETPEVTLEDLPPAKSADEIVLSETPFDMIQPDIGTAVVQSESRDNDLSADVSQEPAESAIAEKNAEAEATAGADQGETLLSSGSGDVNHDAGSSADDLEAPQGLDWDWKGSAPRLKSIPDPYFQIPYDVHLPDQLFVDFSVLSDGTVSSVKLLPPGSGDLDLDRQIRAYVSAFLFEELNSGESLRKGRLSLNLMAMEGEL